MPMWKNKLLTDYIWFMKNYKDYELCNKDVLDAVLIVEKKTSKEKGSNCVIKCK